MMELRDVRRRFGKTEVLHGISLRVPEGSFTSLLGPSGCGKSTALRIMAGLDRPSEGQVLMNGADVAELTAAQRNVAMVFQSYALYPHMTVAENIALPLAMRRMSRVERLPLLGRLLPAARAKRAQQAAKVAEVARTLGLEGLLARKPAQLSGGQKQRAALGRALVRDPSMFLLDEPLSNLDAKLRVEMRSELTSLHRRSGCPFVYVTHDQAEAMSLSDQVIVMMEGRIAQAGSPRELYETPRHRDIAAFIGGHPINLFDAKLDRGRLTGPFAGVPLRARADRAILGLRVEDVWPDPKGPIEARVRRLEYLGNEVVVHAVLADGTAIRALAPGGFAPAGPDTILRLACAPARLHLFDAGSGIRLPTRGESAAA
ncbi:MAG: ABC transporter ATP-binding protein [Kiloniellales bacterium]|nr:ABC transporter ATP-binding protein [Kiloniellales bacterium]